MYVVATRARLRFYVSVCLSAVEGVGAGGVGAEGEGAALFLKPVKFKRAGVCPCTRASAFLGPAVIGRGAYSGRAHALGRGGDVVSGVGGLLTVVRPPPYASGTSNVGWTRVSPASFTAHDGRAAALQPGLPCVSWCGPIRLGGAGR